MGKIIKIPESLLLDEGQQLIIRDEGKFGGCVDLGIKTVQEAVEGKPVAGFQVIGYSKGVL